MDKTVQSQPAHNPEAVAGSRALKPYYERAGVTIYHGDAREILPAIALPSMVLTDPPYGINYRSHHNSGWRENRPADVKWGRFRWRRHENFPGIFGDDKPLDPEHLFVAPLLAIFGGNYCADNLPPSRCWIIWDKRDGLPPNNQADCELVWTNFNKPTRIFRHKWSGIVRAGEENVSRQPKYHPHQKPIALLLWIIQYSGVDRGPIVDPYCGSGSTLIAAARAGLPAVGIEIDEGYCEVAAKRLENDLSDRTLIPDLGSLAPESQMQDGQVVTRPPKGACSSALVRDVAEYKGSDSPVATGDMSRAE